MPFLSCPINTLQTGQHLTRSQYNFGSCSKHRLVPVWYIGHVSPAVLWYDQSDCYLLSVVVLKLWIYSTTQKQRQKWISTYLQYPLQYALLVSLMYFYWLKPSWASRQRLEWSWVAPKLSTTALCNWAGLQGPHLGGEHQLKTGGCLITYLSVDSKNSLRVKSMWNFVTNSNSKYFILWNYPSFGSTCACWSCFLLPQVMTYL